MPRLFNPPQPESPFWTIATVLWLAVLLASAPVSAAEEENEDGDPRWNFKGWTPSLAVALGVHSTDMSGFVRATNSNGNFIRPPNDSTDYAVTPLLRLSLSLETPELPKVPGHIRLFGSVDYYMTFPPDRNIAGEGNPSGFFIRPGLLNPPAEAIEGQGSETAVETNRSAYGLTGGASIPVEIGDFRFFLKPGISWMRYQWNVKGTVLDAQKPPTFGRDFRAIELRARGKLYSSGIGPYFAIEMEPDPWGPILVSAFVEGAYYRAIGNQDMDITDSQSNAGDGLPPDTYLARWGMEVDDEFWRASAGIRVFLAAD